MKRAYGLDIPETVDEAVDLDRTALLVYDMQVGILRQLRDGAGIVRKVGIEPTIRHGADLGYIPIMVEDACGAGDEEAGRRALASLRYMGDALFTDVGEVTTLLRRAKHKGVV